MITTYDVKRHLDNSDIYYCEDNVIINSKTKEKVCTINEMTKYLRKEMHCDFECIYYCDADLDCVYKCKQCGTVIFSGDDEYRYDPNLRCPTCDKEYADNHNIEYWTKEEISNDASKQKVIESYEFIMEERRREDERIARRHGKYDWQIAKSDIRLHKYHIMINLNCDNLFRNKFPLKGLRLELRIFKNSEHVKSLDIPLSISYLRILILARKYRKTGVI